MSQPAFDFGDEALDDAANPTYTVGELADALNATLRRSFNEGVWVRGEIQGWSERGNHAYFTLADDGAGEGGQRAVLNVQFFANARLRLRPLLQRHRLRLGDGMKVRIHGFLDFYAPSGRLGLKMSGIDPRFTLGELSQQRDDVLRRLVASGLVDANKRRRLSPVPLRVGVVTSVGSAAWHDFRAEMERSGLGFQLAVCDVRVQGDYAVEMVTAAVRTLAARPGLDLDLDVVVVIRGGGARNELATFDAEPIALAIANSTVPVFTGLGHEIDRSVADEVAHTSFKTPTACAGALVEAVAGYLARSEQSFAAIRAAACARLDDAGRGLADRGHRIARRTHAAVGRADERLALRVHRLVAGARRPVARDAERVDRIAVRLATRAPQVLLAEERHVAGIEARVRALDPVNVLARGWSITRTADGRVLRSARDAGVDDLLHTQLADGHLTSRVAPGADPDGHLTSRVAPGADPDGHLTSRVAPGADPDGHLTSRVAPGADPDGHLTSRVAPGADPDDRNER